MSGQPIPEFGDRVAGTHYQPRPGSYGVIQGQDGTILVMQTATGLHLPGGGADTDELPEQTLEREVREECGHRVTITRKIGEAVELVFAENEGYFAKECVFFPSSTWRRDERHRGIGSHHALA